jgi:hypothetical protein
MTDRKIASIVLPRPLSSPIKVRLLDEWVAYQWAVVGRAQTQIAEQLCCSQSAVCTAIGNFLERHGAPIRWIHDGARRDMARSLFGLLGPHPWPEEHLPVPRDWRGPPGTYPIVESVRWSISRRLRDTLMHSARQQGSTLRAIGEVWGLSPEQVRQCMLRLGREAEVTRQRVHPRAYLAKPIELDRSGDRDVWHEYSISRS